MRSGSLQCEACHVVLNDGLLDDPHGVPECHDRRALAALDVTERNYGATPSNNPGADSFAMRRDRNRAFNQARKEKRGDRIDTVDVR